MCSFSDWCEGRGLFDLAKVKPIHVAVYVGELQRTHSKPTVKQHLAALRMLLDWLVVGHIKNGGKLEIAQRIAAHESSRTTGLYDRRDEDVNLDEVERIGI